MTKVTIKTPSDYLQTDWSGGKTKQLFLYPENGDYGEKILLPSLNCNRGTTTDNLYLT